MGTPDRSGVDSIRIMNPAMPKERRRPRRNGNPMVESQQADFHLSLARCFAPHKDAEVQFLIADALLAAAEINHFKIAQNRRAACFKLSRNFQYSGRIAHRDSLQESSNSEQTFEVSGR